MEYDQLTSSTEPLYNESSDVESENPNSHQPKVKKTKKLCPIKNISFKVESPQESTEEDEIENESSTFIPGQLVWVKSHRINFLPWWPGIIVERPLPGLKGRRKYVEVLTVSESSSSSTSEENTGLSKNIQKCRRIRFSRSIPAYRILLFGGYKSGGCPMIDERYILILQTNIRLYQGITEYFEFLKETVNSSFNKLKALSSFYIPSQLQDAWEIAKYQIESLYQYTNGSDNKKKFKEIIFSRIKWNNFEVPSYDSDDRNDPILYNTNVTSKKRKYKKEIYSSQSSSPDAEDSEDEEDGEEPEKFHKERKRFQKKKSTSRYEFERLIACNKGECSKSLFICQICHRAGELYKSEKPNGTETSGEIKGADPNENQIYVVSCPGHCGGYAHIDCIGGTYSSPNKCKSCTHSLRACFICHEEEQDLTLNTKEQNNTAPSIALASRKQKITSRCMQQLCRRWFHEKCLQEPPWNNLMRKGRVGSFLCPAHFCLSCWAENPGALPKPSLKFIKCLKCPSAFHPGDWCVPAGSFELSNNWIICPRHKISRQVDMNPFFSSPSRSLKKTNSIDKFLQVTLNLMLEPTNVSWCFICSQGGHIICCETCPASFHEKCLNESEIPEKFICEDCENGRQVRYGQIIWIRLPPTIKDYLEQIRDQLEISTPQEMSRLTQDIESKPFSQLFRTNEMASFTSRINWWPGEVLHPRLMPDEDDVDLRYSRPRLLTRLGFLRVRLFHFPESGQFNSTIDDEGRSDARLWTTVYRVFPFEEGDELRHNNNSTTNLTIPPDDGHQDFLSSDDEESDEDDPLMLVTERQNAPEAIHRKCVTKDHRRSQNQAYHRAVNEAARAWRSRNQMITMKIDNNKPSYYKKIKTNFPIGDVRVSTLHDLSDVPVCDCPIGGRDPCGPTSECLNRRLLYECIPTLCPNRGDCRNQRFLRRDYPPQKPFPTADGRGWGLIALCDIKADDFVNEYVGDLIDEEEANRRLRQAHENSVSNYYMMKLDATRIIDAGPKGNLSRFANHSCNPNLKAQKWMVNGDARIGLFATRDIKSGEELTFDYNFAPVGQETVICKCGANNCTGKIGQQRNNNTTVASTATTTKDDPSPTAKTKKSTTSSQSSNKENSIRSNNVKAKK